MTELMIVVVFALFLLFQGAYMEIKSRSLIKEWANQHDLVIITLNRCYRWRGCYLKYMNLRHMKVFSKGQTVFRVTVKYEESIKDAYVICGGFWTGLLSNEIKVVWS